jgi:hypothetical protein
VNFLSIERYRSFYEQFLGPIPACDGNGEVQISNPFRFDPNPSMFVNLQDGRYNDFGSEEFKGDAYNFYMHMTDATYSAAKKAVDEIVGTPPEGTINVPMPISKSEVEKYQHNLLENRKAMSYLLSTRGLSLAIIEKRKIGYDGERYTIPIYNRYDICVNIRRYNPNTSGGDKMLNYDKGYGSARLYPLENLKKDTVIIHEGEWDTLMQESEGFNAITNTAGASTWLKHWNDLFKNKIVYICYDNDSQHLNHKGEIDNIGLNGARKVAANLYGIAKRVYIVILPLKGDKNDKDITDYYLSNNKTAADFQNLLDSSEEYQPDDSDKEKNNIATTTTLKEARNSSFKGKHVKFNVTVVGKDTAPYNVPSKIKYTCSTCGMNEKQCITCPIMRCGGEFILEVQQNPAILELIKSTSQQQLGVLKSRAGIPSKCSVWESEEIESVNVEELMISPVVSEYSAWDGTSESYILQSAFFIDKDIETNRGYQMKGLMTPAPWNQQVTFLLNQCETLQDDVSVFKMTPELKAQLSIFQTDNIPEKLEEIYKDFSDNVTQIIGRNDLLTGLDLVYHSVLGFNFQGYPITRGWVEMLCIGDTRTGKSETTAKLLQHYNLGEMSAAENTSFAGLVGGLQQSGNNRWMLTWGKIPLNDGRLFVIDEASGLSEEDIGRMSGIRSSGIAEITKIQTERTRARVRTIWLSNPRKNKAMNEHAYGIFAVKDLIGKPEDIARFDFVVTACRDEVPLEEINANTNIDQNVPHKYTSELCKKLILWSWSRTPEQIEFEPEAVEEILQQALEMGRHYSPKVPLVEGANQRIKLARLSISVAARVFSTDETGEKIVVKKCHVQFACDYLDQLYSKPSLGYKEFSSEQMFAAENARIGAAALAEDSRFTGILIALAGRASSFSKDVLMNYVDDGFSGSKTVADFINHCCTFQLVVDKNGTFYPKTELLKVARQKSNDARKNVIKIKQEVK